MTTIPTTLGPVVFNCKLDSNRVAIFTHSLCSNFAKVLHRDNSLVMLRSGNAIVLGYDGSSHRGRIQKSLGIGVCHRILPQGPRYGRGQELVHGKVQSEILNNCVGRMDDGDPIKRMDRKLVNEGLEALSKPCDESELEALLKNINDTMLTDTSISYLKSDDAQNLTNLDTIYEYLGSIGLWEDPDSKFIRSLRKETIVEMFTVIQSCIDDPDALTKAVEKLSPESEYDLSRMVKELIAESYPRVTVTE